MLLGNLQRGHAKKEATVKALEWQLCDVSREYEGRSAGTKRDTGLGQNGQQPAHKEITSPAVLTLAQRMVSSLVVSIYLQSTGHHVLHDTAVCAAGDDVVEGIGEQVVQAFRRLSWRIGGEHRLFEHLKSDDAFVGNEKLQSHMAEVDDRSADEWLTWLDANGDGKVCEGDRDAERNAGKQFYSQRGAEDSKGETWNASVPLLGGDES
eukprot:3317672-Rhodomonas_salina.1